MMSFRPPQRPLPIPPVNVHDTLPLTPSTPLTTLPQYCTSSSESIVSWAEQVQPGTPAPLTPPSDSASSSSSSLASTSNIGGGKKKTRRPSVSRLHLNLSARRPSGIQHSQARSGSASFLNMPQTQPQPVCLLLDMIYLVLTLIIDTHTCFEQIIERRLLRPYEPRIHLCLCSTPTHARDARIPRQYYE